MRTTPAVNSCSASASLATRHSTRPALDRLSLCFPQNYLTFSKAKVTGRVKCLPGVTCYDVTLASPLVSDPKQSQLSSGEHFPGHPQSLCIKLTPCSPSPASFPSSSSLLWWRTAVRPGTPTFLRWVYIWPSLPSLQQLTRYVCLQTIPGWWRWDIPDIGRKFSSLWISKFSKQVISYYVT